MRKYYEKTAIQCRFTLSQAISGYIEGFMSLLAAEKEQAGCARKDIRELRKTVMSLYSSISLLGEHLQQTLILWQGQGATVKDLCQLAGVNYKRVRHRIPADSDFVSIIRECQLDFADAGKRPPTWRDDCPLTLGILAADNIKQIKIREDNHDETA